MTDPFAARDGVPKTLPRATFWAWRDSSLGLDPLSYSLAYTVAPIDGTGGEVTLSTVAASGGFLMEAGGDVTGALKAGRHRWAAMVTRLSDGQTAIAANGVLTVTDPTSIGDRRTPNRRLLDAIQATLEGRATSDHDAYTIEGRSLTRTPFDVLMRWRAKLERAVAAEEGRAARWHKATLR